MLTEEGVVKELKGERARVTTQRGAACADCGTRHACKALGGSDEAEITALNRAEARVGDVVELVLPEKALLWASVMVYLLPIVCLLIGAVLGNAYHREMGLSADGASAIGALCGLAVGLSGTWLASRRAARTGSTMPVIERVVEQGSSLDRPDRTPRQP
jgi:sigma-E factor negative regulatory protein RseC